MRKDSFSCDKTQSGVTHFKQQQPASALKSGVVIDAVSSDLFSHLPRLSGFIA